MKYQVNFLLTFLALILALNYICEAGRGRSMKRRSSARNLIQEFEQQDKVSRPIQRKLKANARSINFGNQGRQSSKDISARAISLNRLSHEGAPFRSIKSSRRQLGGIGKLRDGKKRIQRSSSRRSFQPHKTLQDSQRRFKRQTNRECSCFGKKTIGQEVGPPIESTLMSDIRKHDLNRAFDTSDDFGKLC